MVLITASLAVNPVIKEVDTLQSPNPSGAKTGAITRPINASRLSALSDTTFSLVSKEIMSLPMNPYVTDEEIEFIVENLAKELRC
jgi:hypothetical protein